MSVQELEEHLAASGMRREDIAAISLAAMGLRIRAAGTGPKTDQCLHELTVAEFVDGTVDPDHRAALLDHLASCARCRSELTALSRLMAEPAIRTELEQLRAATSQATRRRRLVRAAGVIGATTAAAALALLLVRPSPQDVDPNTIPNHRATVLTLSAPPVAVAPVGLVEAPIQFVWTSVPRADRYELMLFDQTGSILWEAHTTDTVAVAPDTVILVPGASYFWKAEARIAFDRWTASDLVEFAVGVSSDTTPR
ncbi:MAG: anti-sigma factor family protein [Planctomycetota bacterium]